MLRHQLNTSEIPYSQTLQRKISKSHIGTILNSSIAGLVYFLSILNLHQAYQKAGHVHTNNYRKIYFHRILLFLTAPEFPLLPRAHEVHQTSCALGRSLFSIIRNNCLCILFYNKVSCSDGYATNIDFLASLQSSGISSPATRSHSPFLNALAIDTPIFYL